MLLAECRDELAARISCARRRALVNPRTRWPMSRHRIRYSPIKTAGEMYRVWKSLMECRVR